MQTRYYFAYASNMDETLMLKRCPEATLVGAGVLEGYRLALHGYATIDPDPASSVPVLIWKITEKDEKRLDRFECYPLLYGKESVVVSVITAGGKEESVLGIVYVKNGDAGSCYPGDFYYQQIEDAYFRHGLDIRAFDRAKRESIGM